MMSLNAEENKTIQNHKVIIDLSACVHTLTLQYCNTTLSSGRFKGCKRLVMYFAYIFA